MSDDQIIDISGNSNQSSDDKAVKSITETITVPLSTDMTPSQMAKVLRRTSNILHALVSNLTKYAALGDGVNAGAGSQVIQQIFGAAAQTDSASHIIEQSNSMIATPQMITDQVRRGGGGGMGRA
jgi:hypothetical protein